MSHSHVWHVSFICVTWLIHMCDMTYSHVWHVSFTCVTWLIHMRDMTHSYVWHDSVIHTFMLRYIRIYVGGGGVRYKCWSWGSLRCRRHLCPATGWDIWCICIWTLHELYYIGILVRKWFQTIFCAVYIHTELHSKVLLSDELYYMGILVTEWLHKIFLQYIYLMDCTLSVLLSDVCIMSVFSSPSDLRQFFATHCNTLQHTATHCNTLQPTATHTHTQYVGILDTEWFVSILFCSICTWSIYSFVYNTYEVYVFIYIWMLLVLPMRSDRFDNKCLSACVNSYVT